MSGANRAVMSGANRAVLCRHERLSVTAGGGMRMSVIDRFTDLVATQPVEFAGAELLPVRLARSAVQLLPGVVGAGISVIAEPQFRVPIGASDATAAVAERLQFTVGEGPCLLAHATGRSVFADGAYFTAHWPELFAEMASRTPYRAVMSLPLRQEFHGLGALDLHLSDSAPVSDRTWADAFTIADQITAALAFDLAAELTAVGEGKDPAWMDSAPALRRQRVWIAMGMVNVHLDVNSPDALAVLRAHAYTRGQSLDDLADDLTNRRVPISDLDR